MQRWRFYALVLWAVGVQTQEAIGTVGFALLVASYLPELPRLRTSTLRAWWPLLAFLGWSLIVPAAAGQWPTGTGVARTLDWAALPLVAHAATSLTPAQWRALLTASGATLLVSCLLAGLQHFGVWPSEAFVRSLGWAPGSVYRVYEPIPGTERFMGGGLLFHRLKFSHVSGLALVGVTVAAWKAQRRALLVAAGLAAFAAVWWFPAARMGAVAMTAAVTAALAHLAASPRRALLIVGGAGLACTLMILASPSLRARFESSVTAEGSGQRSQYLRAGLAAVQAHPLTGLGLDQFRPSRFAREDMTEHVRSHPGKAHNQVLSVAAETGVPGALLYLLMLGWLVARARQRPLGALTVGGVSSLVVLGLAHDPLFHAPYSQGVVLLLGLGLSRSDDMSPATVIGSSTNPEPPS